MPEPLPRDPPYVAGEQEMLLSYLDFYRSVMIRKVEGVDYEGLRMSPVESGTCLGGLIKHLAYVERQWFQETWAGHSVEYPGSEEDPDVEFRLDESDTADGLIDLYRRECDISRQILATGSPDDSVPSERGEMSLRWILVHMIEETARHAGHADLIREMVDGSVGD